MFIKGRRIKMEAPIRCDFDNLLIEKGKYAFQVVGDGTVKAQGLFHAKGCYQGALSKYEELEKGIEEGSE